MWARRRRCCLHPLRARGLYVDLEAPVADALGQRLVLLLGDLLEESVHDWIPFVATGCLGGAFMRTTKRTDGFRHSARDAGHDFSAHRSWSWARVGPGLMPQHGGGATSVLGLGPCSGPRQTEAVGEPADQQGQHKHHDDPDRPGHDLQGDPTAPEPLDLGTRLSRRSNGLSVVEQCLHRVQAPERLADHAPGEGAEGDAGWTTRRSMPARAAVNTPPSSRMRADRFVASDHPTTRQAALRAWIDEATDQLALPRVDEASRTSSTGRRTRGALEAEVAPSRGSAPGDRAGRAGAVGRAGVATTASRGPTGPQQCRRSQRWAETRRP